MSDDHLKLAESFRQDAKNMARSAGTRFYAAADAIEGQYRRAEAWQQEAEKALARVAVLEAALEPFAEVAKGIDPDGARSVFVLSDHLFNAAKVLGKSDE